MATQFIEVRSGTSHMRNFSNVVGLQYDSDDGIVKIKDQDGVVRPLFGADTDEHLFLNTVSDGKTVRINSRGFVQTSGSSIGLQSKPNQTVTTTGDVIGAEFSPRANDCDAGAIIAIKADPVVKDATSARTVSALRGLEINIDLPNAGSAVTFTNDVSAIRIFADFGSGHTFSGVKAILEIAAPNTSQFDVLMEIEATNSTWINATGSLGSQIGQILIRVAGTTRALGYYATS